MKLNEVFDSPGEWEQKPGADWAPGGLGTHNPELANRRYEKDLSYWSVDTYTFSVGKEKYEIEFSPVTDKDSHLQPAPNGLPKFMDYVALGRNTKNMHGDELRGNDAISGTGNAHKVFATAGDIIKKHIKRTGVPVVIGSKQSEPSRVKLYSRIFDKIASLKWKSEGRQPEVHWLLTS